MKLDKILDYVNSILNKEQKGNMLKPSRFNTLLEAVNITLFEREYQLAGQTAAEKVKPLYDILLSNRAMKRFITPTDITITAGKGTLPATFREQLTAVFHVEKSSCPVDFVSEERLNRFRFSMMETPKTDEYAAVVRGSDLYVFPMTPTPKTLQMIYLREPVTPFYDYCLGTQTDYEYYMPVGSRLDNGTLKQGNTVLQTNVIHPSGVSTGYNSASVELDWDTAMHIAFANEILIAMGVNLQDQFTYQHSQNERAIK